MLVSFAVAVFLGAIIILFSDEFTRMGKKIFEIKGAALLLPLALGSWGVYVFQDTVLWLLYYYHTICTRIIGLMCYLLPDSSYSVAIVRMLFLSAVAILPIWIWEYVTHKRAFAWYSPSYRASTILWLATAIILIVA